MKRPVPINALVLSGSTSSPVTELSARGAGGTARAGPVAFAGAGNGTISASFGGRALPGFRLAMPDCATPPIRRRGRLFPPPGDRLYSRPMRRYLALFCVWWIALGCARVPSDILRFGMTTGEVASVYGDRMSLVSNRRGAATYVVQQPAAVPGIYPPLLGERLYLQFRKDRLTGWKNEWNARDLWF